MQRRGFTLVEMMVVVAVVGIGGALAAYNMSDHVHDARARAEANEVVLTLRAEHRRAREQMRFLKVASTEHQVTYTHTRDAACATPLGTPRTEKYQYASLKIVNAPAGFACFGDRSSLPAALPGGGGGGGVKPGQSNNSNSGTEGEGEDEAGSGEMVFVVEAGLADGRSELFMPVRIDPAGIVAMQMTKVATTDADNLLGEIGTNPDGTLLNSNGGGDLLTAGAPPPPPPPGP
jgi:prepilin-type N-terminal cleavage/methylation domain-containing protein